MSTREPSRPVLRYLGGKWRLAPWIIAQMPAHRVYVEPFCGAASVLMRKERAVAEIINDRSGDIVNLFRVMRDPELAERLTTAVRLTPFARDEYEAAYETTRDPVERARRLLLRSFAGFHPGSATSERPKGMNTQTSTWRVAGRLVRGTTKARDWMNYPDAIGAFTERLRGVVVDNADGRTLLDTHDDEETLFYVDPPYLHSTRNIDATSGRYQFELSAIEHEGLLAQLLRVKARVMLSAYGHPMYEDRLPAAGWLRRERGVIAHNGARRREVLWINPAAQRAAALECVA